MKLKYKGLPTDIWLVFGSYVYGFEGTISLINGNILEIVLCTGSEKDGAELLQFFEEMALNPRDLLKTEVRIYCDEKGSSTLSFPIALFTDLMPVLVSPIGPCLRFSYLRGVSPSDEQAWQQFLGEAC